MVHEVIIVIDYEKMLPQRLSQLRIKKGASARDMSLSIGQGQAYINNIENAKSFPSMRSFFFICEYLNISPKDFFDYEVSNPEKLKLIFEDMKTLNDEQLSTISSVIKGIKK
jgi:Predicted transcriptional regulators